MRDRRAIFRKLETFSLSLSLPLFYRNDHFQVFQSGRVFFFIRLFNSAFFPFFFFTTNRA